MTLYQLPGASAGNETPFFAAAERKGWMVHADRRVSFRQCRKSCAPSGADPATRRLPGGPAPPGAGSIKANGEQSWMDPFPVYAQGPYDRVSDVA